MAFAAPILVAATILSTAVSAVGAVMQAQQQSNANRNAQNQALAAAQAEEYNAAVKRNNAIVAERNAKMKRDQAFDDAEQRRIIANRATARGEVNLLASGVELSGSGLDVLADNSTQMELDAVNTQHRGQIDYWNGMVEKNNILAGATLNDMGAAAARNQAAYYGNASKSAGVNAAIGVAGAVAGGAAQMASINSKYSAPTFGTKFGYA